MKLSQLKTFSSQFIESIHQAQQNHKSSLKYLVLIPPQSTQFSAPATHQTIIVGGSNTTICKNHSSANSIQTSSLQTVPTPQLKTQEHLDEFITSLILSDSNSVAINLAFPVEPIKSAKYPDGVILNGSKEHPLNNLIQTPYGQHLTQIFQVKRNRTIHVAVANDVHCLLLAGIKKLHTSPIATMVLGTGINLGFYHHGKLVNLESGGFSQIPVSKHLQQIDSVSQDPGQHLFEKATSGAYLHLYFNHQVSPSEHITSTKQLCYIAAKPRHVHQKLASNIIHKSASLVAAQIFGIYSFLGSDILDLLIEGSLYWACPIYQKSFQSVLTQLGIEKQIHTHHIQNSGIVGAAQLFNPKVFTS